MRVALFPVHRGTPFETQRNGGSGETKLPEMPRLPEFAQLTIYFPIRLIPRFLCSSAFQGFDFKISAILAIVAILAIGVFIVTIGYGAALYLISQ